MRATAASTACADLTMLIKTSHLVTKMRHTEQAQRNMNEREDDAGKRHMDTTQSRSSTR